MKIKEILNKTCIQGDLKASSKEDVINELAALLARSHETLSQDQVVQVLIEREKLGSTGIGNGVAIPHGKLAGLEHIVAGFGRSRKGVPFDSQDGKPPHLFFILIAPENAASLHLKALARLSRLLKNSHFRDKLMEAPTNEELFQAIVTEDEKF